MKTKTLLEAEMGAATVFQIRPTEDTNVGRVGKSRRYEPLSDLEIQNRRERLRQAQLALSADKSFFQVLEATGAYKGEVLDSQDQS